MNFRPKTSSWLWLIVGAIGVLHAARSVHAQGSIFGELRGSDMSVPPDTAIQLLGFINNLDREIRIQSCIGAGYEDGHWYDDFQNYVSEAPGLAYHYYFFDVARTERVVLNKTIPANSFQQEDVILAAGSFPLPPSGLQVVRLDAVTVRLDWLPETGTTWHVYRRDGNSTGSFFRIDNPSGDRTDRGETQPFYVDRNVDSARCYYYVVVAESTADNYSPASKPIFIDLTSCCNGLVGDINGLNGDEPTIGDISLLIDQIFIYYTEPACLPEADVNQTGGLHPTMSDVSISDVTILIDHLYISFAPLRRCSDAAP